ncbi:MAG: hypothetical protein J6K91_05855 [Opitutales bacterium]|nr:hypothetical protein [Opitutales bacterium]
MNANINNQEISLHSISNSFFTKTLAVGSTTKVVDELPANVSFVKIQADKEIYYLSNQDNVDVSNGFVLSAGKEKIFCRREALGLKVYASEASSLRIQPLSHD